MAKKPFNDAFSKLKALAKASARAEPKAAVRPEERRPAPEPPRPRELTEDELWSSATTGVKRVERGAETVPPPPPPRAPESFWHPDLDALDELKALVSGEGPFDVADTDEFIEGRASGVDGNIVRKLRRGEFAVQGHVDLHGLTRDEAKRAVEEFLRASRNAGKRCVLVVHGRGTHSKDQIPVLKDALRTWLATARFGRLVLAFATARPVDGGAGAIYVLLRRAGR